MKNIINQRVAESIKNLIDLGVVKSQRKLSEKIQESPTKINEILKEKSNVDTELIYKLFKEFSLNPMFVITGLGQRFIEQNLIDELKNEEQTNNSLNIYDSFDNQQKLIKMYEDKIEALETELFRIKSKQL
ncbi:hypothetical protein [Empedobacter brevis]|uniref:hypothetical protein n=1 Tax=Empedobacter brevis TaxID=247 RepID=UPI0028D63C15|nr:hypothetical protein [Empedobacter brevis]